MEEEFGWGIRSGLKFDGRSTSVTSDRYRQTRFNLMDAALLVGRLFLASVFAIAAIAKLFDLKGSKKAITDFGLWDWAAGPLGIALPVVELAIAEFSGTTVDFCLTYI